MSKLRLKMVGDMKLRNFSPKTQDAYLRAVSGLAKFYNRSPNLLTSQEIQKYLLHLTEERKLSWSSYNLAVCGLRFFYTRTLERKAADFFIPPRKKETRLPEILSSRELELIFSSVSTLYREVKNRGRVQGVDKSTLEKGLGGLFQTTLWRA